MADRSECTRHLSFRLDLQKKEHLRNSVQKKFLEVKLLRSGLLATSNDACTTYGHKKFIYQSCVVDTRSFFFKMSRTRANGCWGEDSDLEAERLRPALRGRPKAGLSVI
jgi:hypothetical protein